MAEVLLYSPIFSFISELFIREMEEAKGEDVVIRINTPGGDVLASWGMIAKAREHEEENEVTIKVDGQAASMGAYFLLFFNNVEGLDFSRFTLHRASLFNEEGRTDAQLTELKEINKQLRSAMESKLNIPRFEKLAGITMDEFFNGEKAIDVNFNAKKAKSIGLIKKITTLAPEQAKALGEKFAAYHKNGQPEPKKDTKMTTLAELKEEHPALYAQLLAQGVEEGVAKEADRVGAWSAFINVDPKAVVEGIKSGKDLSQTAMADFTVKAMSADQLNKIKAENADETETTENDGEGSEGNEGEDGKGDGKGDKGEGAGAEESAEAKKVSEFEATVAENMGLKAVKA